MTRDEILAMEAGDASNTLIATEVLGYQVFERYDYLYIATDEAAFERGMKHGLGIWNITPSSPDEVRLCLRLPDYFGNIAAAWEVANRICDDLNLLLRLHRNPDYCWVGLDRWSAPRLSVEAQAIIASEAICRAALLAVMEVDE